MVRFVEPSDGILCLLNVPRSLVDRGTQYFLAGAVRTGQVDSDEEVITTGEWFGCQTVPTPGGLCEVGTPSGNS
jgi:hypothetical protein